MPNHFRFEEADHGLGHRVIVGIPAAAHRRFDASRGQALAVPNREVLGGFNRSWQHLDD